MANILSNCRWCSREFVVRSGSGKFCSRVCSGTNVGSLAKGRSFTKSHRERLSQSMMGKNLGRKRSERGMVACPCGKTFEATVSQIKSGKKKYCCRDCYYKYRPLAGFAADRSSVPMERGKEYREKISRTRIEKGVARGKNNPNWAGGVTKIGVAVRNLGQYKKWRAAVYKRDGYRCIQCDALGNGRNLQADHTYPLSMIIREEGIKTSDDAINCSRIWDISNGRTLCSSCHKNTDSYGWLATNNYIRKINI